MILQICYNTTYVQNGLAIKIIKTDDWLDVDPVSGFVAQGQTEQITLTVDTEDMESGDYDCDLILSSNDPNGSLVNIPVNLIISGSFPLIDLSETSFDFGMVNIGGSVTDTLIISNLGNEVLSVSDIEIDLDVFSVNMTSFIVDPGQSEELYITFSPLEAVSYIAAMNITSNDPLNSIVEVELIGNHQFPIIELSAYSIDFGNVSIGDEVTDTLTIFNLGNEILLVSDIQVDLPEFTVSMTSFFVDPEGSEDLYITFSPDELTAYNAIMTIYSNDPENSQINVALSGSYQAPIIDISTTIIDFGGVVLGEQSTETLVVFNLGNDILHVSDVELNSDVFSAAMDDFIVDPGDSEELFVTFEPNDIDPSSATLILHSNDPVNPSIEVELTGETLYPVIELSTTSLNFGSVYVGETLIDTLIINNNGTAILSVTQIELISEVYSVNVTELNVNPGNSEELLVTFAPDSVATEIAEIILHQNDPINPTSHISLSGIGVDPVNSNDILPLITEVFQNYPNPFNPETTIKYSLTEPSNVSILIYNIKGEKVKTLVQQFQEPQFYQAVWNGKDDASKPVASGVYFYVTRIGNYKSFNKMLLIK